MIEHSIEGYTVLCNLLGLFGGSALIMFMLWMNEQ